MGASTDDGQQKYKFGGKELDRMYRVDWYDFDARQQDTLAGGRFLTIDPLCVMAYNISPYVYYRNNPLKFIDPSGMLESPIYNTGGDLLGTDDEGLQGAPIIMNENNFKQGMSHQQAKENDLGVDGLADNTALSKFLYSFASLPSRPDFDGKLTLVEANQWYRTGKGQPLFIDINSIDLSGIFSYGEKFVGEIKSINLLTRNFSESSFILGNITLKRYPNHKVRAYSNKYDFEMHAWKNPLNWGRNIETIIGSKVAGQGYPYEINIYGSTKITPILPFLK